MMRYHLLISRKAPCVPMSLSVMLNMKNILSALILMTMIPCSYARSEYYVPEGFIKKTAGLLSSNIAVVTIKVKKSAGPGKPLKVQVIEVLYGPRRLKKITEIHDDGFDPVFGKKFKADSKWILRIKPLGEERSGGWVISYYETSHLEIL